MPASKKKTAARKKLSRKAMRRKKLRQRRLAAAALFGLALLATVMILFLPFHLQKQNKKAQIEQEIIQTAAKYNLSDHLDQLMAIYKVESNGEVEDVFQSSESLGLPPNTLDQSASIDQGCRYFRYLLDTGQSMGVDENTILQAYNYGEGYLSFVAQNGGVHTPALAQEYSRIQSDGAIVSYLNPIAIARNGGWKYEYGNMFYVDLVRNNL